MPFKHYLTSISSALKAGNATEHTYRPALKTLIESLATGVTATNEPKREACGAPDFIVTKGPIPIGYVEAKDVGKSLDEIEDDEQLKRYRTSLRNLILTDCLEFRYFRNGEPVTSARIAHIQKNGVVKSDPEGIAQTAQLFSWFFQAEIEAVGTPKELAQKMAALARMIHDLIAKAFTAEAQEGYRAGMGGAAPDSRDGLPIPPASARPPGDARSCLSEERQSYFCSWVLLART